MKKKLLSLFAAVVVLISLSGCQSGETWQTPPLNEAVVSETTTFEETTQTSETTVAEILEETQAEENIQTDKNVTETIGEESVETIFIANQEIPIDAESVTLYISDVQNTTDISGLKNLSNLKSLQLFRSTDGNTPYVCGFDVLKNCDTITSICIQVGFENDEDIYILETLPNLKSLSIYGVTGYEFWNFNLNEIEDISLIGTIDLAKIEHLTSLKSLYIEYNNSTDLTPIEKLENLEGLQILESGFIDYSSIIELEKLEGLYICSMPMTEEMYNKLVKKLPNCEITVTNLLVE